MSHCVGLCSPGDETQISGGTQNWSGARFTFSDCLFVPISPELARGDWARLLISNLNLRQKGPFLVPTVGQTVKSLLSPQSFQHHGIF